MTIPDDLLELQRLDTQLDQLRHRREHAPEHDQLAAARGAVADWEKRSGEVRGQLEELARSIRSEEAAGADLSAETTRLEKQLRTVFATREAEALMHEIDSIKARRDELDNTELDHLESQERLEAELAELGGQEAQIRDVAEQASAALAAQLAQIDSEVASITERRAAQQALLPEPIVQRYERLRITFGGVAIARLNGKQCEGCHLEIAAAELDGLRATPADEMAECPQCGRMLVV